MVRYDWLEVETELKEEWRFALIGSGELFVMTLGGVLKQWSSAISLASIGRVSTCNMHKEVTTWNVSS